MDSSVRLIDGGDCASCAVPAAFCGDEPAGGVAACVPAGTDLPALFANTAGVLLEGGDGLFVGNAAGFVRLNLAMPRSVIEKGLTRMRDCLRSSRRDG